MSQPTPAPTSPTPQCAEPGCAHPAYDEEQVQLRYCIAHSQIKAGRLCNQRFCQEPPMVGNDFCLAHCPTPVASPPSSQEEDVEEEVIVRRRDASPKRPKTPRQRRGPLKCPPAPKKAGPVRSVSMPQLPYQPGEEMLFPRQRLTKKCACGGDLKITDMDMGRYRGTVITCNWYCGFVINRTLPKYVMAPKVINWGPQDMFGRLEAAFPALQN